MTRLDILIERGTISRELLLDTDAYKRWEYDILQRLGKKAIGAEATWQAVMCISESPVTLPDGGVEYKWMAFIPCELNDASI